MSPKKGAAKPAPAKKRARKAKKAVAAPVVEGPKDWPPGVTEEQAQGLFDLIASGDFTVKTAAPEVGMKGELVYQWKRRYPTFGALLDEAVDIGIDMATDGYREVTAHNRDTAAAAMVEMTALDKYLQRKRPERFHINPFKPALGGGDGGGLLGVVLVPMKMTQTDERPVIEGSAVRVPMKALTS